MSGVLGVPSVIHHNMGQCWNKMSLTLLQFTNCLSENNNEQKYGVRNQVFLQSGACTGPTQMVQHVITDNKTQKGVEQHSYQNNIKQRKGNCCNYVNPCVWVQKCRIFHNTNDGYPSYNISDYYLYNTRLTLRLIRHNQAK